ncbi:hypothetical protein T484DRAFT_1876865 [Baffinella frigidus]|nr:hypothetical protein T484DRAFT_1876865 [Cryptophyta sp. CCMP2293]|mmetsp:Transcript_32966/g.78108  ORF Transcript_32966/g.78108 Transcript_32966/m.78108 type:complete len:146 (+) Transcript_32966:77-514(+)
MSGSQKLSTPMATMARSSGMQGKTKDGVLRLYRNVQKEVPWLLSIYGIDADPVEVRGKIAQVFRRHGTGEIEPRVAKMLIFKGQLELDEAMAQWKTRTHIMKYVQEVGSAPHLGRSKIGDSPLVTQLKKEMHPSMRKILEPNRGF